MRTQEALDGITGQVCVYYKDEKADTWRDDSGRAYTLRYNEKTGEVFSFRNPELDIKRTRKKVLPVILSILVLVVLIEAVIIFLSMRKNNNGQISTDTYANISMNVIDDRISES